MWKQVIGVVAVFGFCAGAAVAGETTIEKDARVYIIWPKDGQVINGGKLWVRMGTRNAGIAPANIKKANTGHQCSFLDLGLHGGFSPLGPQDLLLPQLLPLFLK